VFLMGRLKKKKSNDAAWTQKDEAVPNVVAETHPVTVRIKNGLPYIAITFVILAAGVASASLFGLIQHVPGCYHCVFNYGGVFR
jgi:hypothetical protein